MEGQTPHKRRVHYSGTHPKNFKEKYKEQNPEKYASTILKVIKKGSTPAGMHISIMVQEILDFFDIKPGQKGIDCTLGYGGHTRKMMEKLEGNGFVIGLDIDPIESVKTEKRLRDAGFGADIFALKNINFAKIDEAASGEKFDFVLADLGVSSMQIDNPDRGFSYKIDGPLDLRMNPNEGESAADRINSMDFEEIVGMLIDNSDEPYAEEIAERIVFNRKRGNLISTTKDLKEVVEKSVMDSLRAGSKNKYAKPNVEEKEAVKKSCARVFQALRIDVNSEFEVLYEFLEKLPTVLKPGGKAAILTFHSGEDRLVKKAFKEGEKNGTYLSVSKDVIRPSAEECNINPRAKSTKMRWAIRG